MVSDDKKSKTRFLIILFMRRRRNLCAPAHPVNVIIETFFLFSPTMAIQLQLSVYDRPAFVNIEYVILLLNFCPSADLFICTLRIFATTSPLIHFSYPPSISTHTLLSLTRLIVREHPVQFPIIRAVLRRGPIIRTALTSAFDRHLDRPRCRRRCQSQNCLC